METKETNVKGIYKYKSGKYYGMVYNSKKFYYTKTSDDIEEVEEWMHDLKHKLSIEELKAELDAEKQRRKEKRENINYYDKYDFKFKHIGAEGQQVYSFKGVVFNKFFYIELIQCQKKGWAYHAEGRYGFLIDSRISDKYYESMQDCIVALDNSLKSKFFKQKI